MFGGMTNMHLTTRICCTHLKTSMLKALKTISAVGISLTLFGFAGLGIASRAYPNSNLLGGWALFLGPVYWLGMVVCCFAVLGWIVAGLFKLWRKWNKDDGNGGKDFTPDA